MELQRGALQFLGGPASTRAYTCYGSGHRTCKAPIAESIMLNPRQKGTSYAVEPLILQDLVG